MKRKEGNRRRYRFLTWDYFDSLYERKYGRKKEKSFTKKARSKEKINAQKEINNEITENDNN